MLSYVLLLSDGKGEAVSWALNVFGPVDAFHVLRKFSNLSIRVPEDTPLLEPFLTREQARKMTVCIDSARLTFPPFTEIASISEKVRCYFLYLKLHDKAAVARIMGWRIPEVRNTYVMLHKRMKSLRGAL